MKLAGNNSVCEFIERFLLNCSYSGLGCQNNKHQICLKITDLCVAIFCGKYGNQFLY